MSIENLWYGESALRYLLWPLSCLYRFIMFVRHYFYKIKLFKSYRAPVPIIVVGNITVGGTGKTPLVIALVLELKKRGFHPGIITRGYGGKSKTWPQSIDHNADPVLFGDEAILLFQNTKVPVMAGPNRADSIKKLLASHQCDVIVSDDGLQHYAMARDIEIVVVDSMRRFGNGFCLPAGPLREPLSRLKTVDFIISNGGACGLANEYHMHFVIDEIVNVVDESRTLPVGANIIAVAGIGNPDRFFASLRALQFTFTQTVFPDHYAFTKTDFDFLGKDDVVVMTEKDAVKCRAFADARFWVARGRAEVEARLMGEVVKAM